MMLGMAWATGTNIKGREIGYLVEAECDDSACEEKIDRGLAFVCGAEHDGGERGCGNYFCAKHLLFVTQTRLVNGFSLVEKTSPQLCQGCADEWRADHPDLT